MAPQASTPAEDVCFCLPQDSSLHSLCSVPAMHDMGLQASTPAEDVSCSLFLFTLRSQPAFSLLTWAGGDMGTQPTRDSHLVYVCNNTFVC